MMAISWPSTTRKPIVLNSTANLLSSGMRIKGSLFPDFAAIVVWRCSSPKIENMSPWPWAQIVPGASLAESSGGSAKRLRVLGVFLFIQLLRQIVLYPHLIDSVQLAFQPVNMHFLVHKYLFQQLA